MFEVLASFLTAVLTKIGEKGVDFAHNNLSTRRNILSCLLNLFNSLSDLELKSKEIYREFSLYANGRETVTKVIPARKPEDLNKSFSEFLDSLEKVNMVLEIYDPNLRVTLLGALQIKGRLWKQIDFSQDIVPKVLEVEDKLTFLVTFPAHPPEEASSTTDDLKWTAEDLDRMAPLIRQEILERMKLTQVDIRINADLRNALSTASDSIKEIEKAKLHLAELIRKNFPLEKLVI